jgi:superfamily II DNA or RNA helicase
MNKVVVQLGNRKATFQRPFPWEEFNDVLKYRKPGWEYSQGGRAYIKNKAAGVVDENGKIPGWDGYIHLMKDCAVGTGAFLALKEKLEEEASVKFIVEDYRKPVLLDKNYKLPDKARGYQEEAFKEMLKASKTGGLILQATGSGKTFGAGLYFSALQGGGVFFVDELTLLDQAQKELEKVIGEPVGNIGNQKFNPKRITVATIQTVHLHRFDPGFLPWIKTIKAMFIDEIHLALNRRNFQTVAAIKPQVIFGLTATLELKKKHVALRAYDLAGPIVFEYPLETGVKEGFLSKGVAVSVQLRNPIPKVAFRGFGYYKRMKFYRELYRKEYVEVIVEAQKRNKLIRDLILEARKKGKYTIVLLERIKHLKDLSNSLDIPHDLVFGEKKVFQRIESKRRFEAGDIRVILTNKIFQKGIDIKRVDLIVDGAGMKSTNTAIQKYGRGVRLCDEKQGLLYLDIADAGNRFEKAALSRRVALKKIGVPVFIAESDLGAKKILELAQKKLDKIT